MGGNDFGFPPMMGRLDASFGQVLLGDGKGNWQPQTANISGLELRGEIRDIQKLHTKKKDCLLILQNNETPVLYSIQKAIKQ
jgi:hypothetical protein